MKLTQWFGMCLGLAMLSLPACKSEGTTTVEEPGAQGVTIPGTNEPSTNEATAVPGVQPQAREQIAEARCAQEARCANIGPGKDYATLEACLIRVNEEWRDDLNIRECPGGVVMKEFAECLGEIRDNECGNPFGSLGQMLACRESDICKAL